MYGQEVIDKAYEYLNTCEDYYDEETGRLVVNIPKVEGMALHLGVTRETLYDWSRKYDEFSYILQKMNERQASRVIDNALSGNYNSQIAKLLLGKHGYKESTEVDHTTKGEKIERANDRTTEITKRYEYEIKDTLKNGE